jgi:hypothetical protein
MSWATFWAIFYKLLQTFFTNSSGHPAKQKTQKKLFAPQRGAAHFKHKTGILNELFHRSTFGEISLKLIY